MITKFKSTGYMPRKLPGLYSGNTVWGGGKASLPYSLLARSVQGLTPEGRRTSVHRTGTTCLGTRRLVGPVQ